MNYRRATQVMPGHPSAYNCLGIVLAQQGKLAESVASFQQASRCDPGSAEIHNNLGVALTQAGRAAEAVASFHQAQRLRPGYAEAHYNLGLALRTQDQNQAAIEQFQQALRLRPSYPEALNDLGNALNTTENPLQAINCYRQALAIRPDYAEAHYNLAFVLAQQGQVDEAICQYREALRYKPDYVDAHINLGNVYRQQGQLAQAAECYHQALRHRPGNAEAHSNLGWIFTEQGRFAEAVAAYEQAMRLKPDTAETYHNLGLVRRKQGMAGEAIRMFQRALQLKPDFAEVCYSLGNALCDGGQLEEGVGWFRRAIELKPDFAEAHNNLAGALAKLGHAELSVASFQEAVRLRPDLPEVQSNLLFGLNYDPGADPDAIFAAYRRWGESQKSTTPLPEHANDPSPERRLRIGYVSPDLRQHALARYFEPILAHHDPRHVEVFCYAEVAVPDAVTTGMQKLAHHWRWTSGQTDSQVIERIRADGIDILVDLAGHTDKNRLRVFAQKPAPVQATWMGYLNTTGLTTMDYRLTDEILDPPGMPVRDTEELFRLPLGMCCFAPPIDAPPVAPLPALRRGYLTFGALHHLFKLNSAVYDTWSKLLHAMPTARLLMFRDSLTATAQAEIRRQFAERGIQSGQLDLRLGRSTPGYLGIYEEIDVGLDAFPCTGGVTTCESLWMGVPVLSLCGVRPATRNSAAILARAGIRDWAVDTPDEYIAFALGLTDKLEQLAQLRSQLREAHAGKHLRRIAFHARSGRCLSRDVAPLVCRAS